MDNNEIIKEFAEKNSKLEEELRATKEHLKKYTAPSSRKVYYENNKEKEKQRAKEYKEKTNYKPTPEQKKIYNQQAYIKKRDKYKTEMEENQTNGNV